MSAVSLATTKSPLVILSTDDPIKAKTYMDSKNLAYQRVVGTYKGKWEYSFVVHPDTAGDLATEGLLDKQETVLYLEKLRDVGAFKPHLQRHAWFMPLNLSPESYAGIFKPVDKPEFGEDYTYVDKNYYVIRQNKSRQKVHELAARLANIVFDRIVRSNTKAVKV